MKNQKSDLIKQGYTIVSSDKEYTTFERPKKFSWGWFIFWVFFGFIGAICYLVYFAGKQNEKITIKN